MNDKFGMMGKVHYLAWHEDGSVFYEHTTEPHNQIQNLLLNSIADWLQGLSVASPSSVSSMAIGTGADQVESDTVLDSLGTWENAVTIAGSEGSHWTATSTTSAAVFTTTFTGWAGAVTEAGLFSSPSAMAGMYAYDTSISVTLTVSDSLQVTWTITAA